MKEQGDKNIKRPIKDFLVKKICQGDVYLASTRGRLFHILRPGVLIDESFVQKFSQHEQLLEYREVTDQKIIWEFIEIFKELKSLQYESELRLKAKELLNYFVTCFSNQNHFLSFVLACHSEFCAIPEEDILKIHETNLYLLKKSLYSAALAVIIGISNDFYHYLVIKDFYNMTLGLDIGLCEKGYSYFLAQACNQENHFPGTGKNYLIQNDATELEIRLFLEHPQKSYEYFKNRSDILAHPELIEMTLYQHELSNGQGFPRKIIKSQFSRHECVMLLASSLIDVSEEFDFETDILTYVLSIQVSELQQVPVRRVYTKLCVTLKEFLKFKERAS